MPPDAKSAGSHVPAAAQPVDRETERLIRNYSAGLLSARATAAMLGEWATEHDVFALVRRLGLPLPRPSEERLEAEVAAGMALYRTRERAG